MSTTSIGVRAAFSAVAFVGFGLLNTAHEIVSPLVSGPAAVAQLSDTNSGYVESQVASRLFNGSGLPVVLLLVVIGLIWLGPILRLFKSATKPTETV